MSFEAELRLPAKQQYAYINITIKGETFDEFSEDLLRVSADLVSNLTVIHRDAADIVMKGGLNLQDHVDNRSAESLITEELGGKVVSVEEKPWNRDKPAAKEVNFF